MKRNFLFLIFGFAGLAISSGCKTHKAAEMIVAGTWMVKSMYGKSVEEVDFMRGSPSIIFKDSTSFSGSTGCNQYSAKLSQGEFGVRITMGPMTKMACPGDEESVFIKALTESNRIKREKNEMIFFKNDEEVLRFQAGL